MTTRYQSVFAVLGLCLAVLLSGAASQQRAAPKTTKPQTIKKTKRVSLPVYTPPRRGAPRGRVGGGSRGPGDERPVLALLAPDHTGLTVQQSPDLFWYISKLPDHPIELTINDEESIKPLLEVPLEGPIRPGIQRIRLDNYNVRLKPGIEYEWFVALVIDRDSRSKDIIAGGWLERIEKTDELQQELRAAQRTEVPFIYAAAGLWYDAVNAISDLIDESPHDSVLRQQRTALLEQVGSTEIAASAETATSDQDRAPEE